MRGPHGAEHAYKCTFMPISYQSVLHQKNLYKLVLAGHLCSLAWLLAIYTDSDTVDPSTMKKTIQLTLLVLGSLLLLHGAKARHMTVTRLGGERELKLSQSEVSYQQLVPSEEKPQPTTCPAPTCANPEKSSMHSDNCPPSDCDKSLCKFRGCVHYGAFGPQWMPDPCTICSCHGNQELCTAIECQENLECYGHPTRVKEGDCCPSCDFGVPEKECGVVPTGVKSLYAALGDKDCQTDVLVHGCDKEFILGEDGKIYRCRPVEETQTYALDQACSNGINQMTYLDVSRCVKEEISPWQLPQDYDFSPRECSYYVKP